MSESILIVVAGTSYGGSSYATRILKVLDAHPAGVKIQINITAGDYQEQVYNALVDVAKLIESAASKISDTECSFNFQIKKNTF